MLYLLDVLLYCVVGALFLVAWILAMAPAKQTTMFGLIMLFWPFVLLFEAILILSRGFGQIGEALATRLKKAA